MQQSAGEPRRGPVQSQGFGKRGRVDLPSRSGEPPQSEPPVPEPHNGGLGIPKWAIGAVAAMFLFAMVIGTGGGGSGSGLLGGLIGGLIAGKMLAGNKPTSTATTQPTRAGGTTTAAASTTAPKTDVNRGGFGSTAAKTTSSSGIGFSFGG